MNFQSLKESEIVSQATHYYQQLAPKDQLALKILAAFALVMVVIFGFLIPANTYNQVSQRNYMEGVDTLSWMKANQHHFTGDSSSHVERDSTQSLLSVANATSKKYRISFKRYEPMGDKGLALWLEGIVFNKLVVWLELLDKRYAIQVKEISVDLQDEKGLVNVRLVLQE